MADKTNCELIDQDLSLSSNSRGMLDTDSNNLDDNNRIHTMLRAVLGAESRSFRGRVYD